MFFNSIINLLSLFVLVKFNVAFLDSAEPWQISFQAPATPIMEGIINFHNHIMFFMIAIGIFVMWLLGRCLVFYSVNNNNLPIDNFTHATTVEIVWTIVPAFILILIAMPSFALLYSMDEMLDPAVTLKVVGHQWYWSYEYSDYNHLTEQKTGINFDSYMIAEENLEPGHFRLLEVDHRVVLPMNTHVRVLITSADVLHSWAVPSFGVKVDACPGRLNQTNLFIKRSGVFYGQCSELCGVNHGFMPICVEAVDLNTYTEWLSQKIIK